jgi:hypothetical protein
MAGYVQSAQASSSTSSVSLAFPIHPGDGHAIVVAGRAVAATPPTTTCTDTQLSTYVHAAGIWNSNNATTKFQTDVFVTAASSAAADTVTYKDTLGIATVVDLAIHEYSGLAKTNAAIIDSNGVASAIDPGGAGTTSPLSGSKTPASPNCVLFGALAFNTNSATYTAGNMGTGVPSKIRQSVSSLLVSQDTAVVFSDSYQTNGTLSAAENWSALFVPLVALPYHPITAPEIAAGVTPVDYS